MYDYRNDIIKLMKKTGSDEASLFQSAVALNIISKALMNNEQISDLNKKLQEKISNELSDDITSKKIDESTANIPVATDVDTKKVAPAGQVKIIKKHQDPMQDALNSLVFGEYLIVDKLSGCVAKNSKGEDVTYFSERIKRDLNLENGDIVALDYNKNNDYYYMNRIIDKVDIPDPIVRFKYAKVEHDAFGLFITRSITNKQLSNTNLSTSRLALNSQAIVKFSLKEGDVVDLAWYKDTSNIINVIWKYSGDMETESSAVKGKHSDYAKTSANKEINLKLNFDLDGKSVALVTADDSVVGKFDEIVKKHNGKPIIVEAKNGANVVDRLASFDLVIVLQNYMSHETSKPIFAKYKDTKDLKLALSETAGQLNLEKAIYRALNGIGIIDRDSYQYPLNIDKN